ncbi:hypothetical protein EBZ39_05995 [bacterium]|nr:hypothetical protein [bacterium]
MPSTNSKRKPETDTPKTPPHWIGAAVKDCISKNKNGVYGTLMTLGISYVSYYRMVNGRTQFKSLTLAERIFRSAGLRLLIVNTENEVVYKSPDTQ